MRKSLRPDSWLTEEFLKKFGNRHKSRSKNRGEGCEEKTTKRVSADRETKRQSKMKKTLTAIYAKQDLEFQIKEPKKVFTKTVTEVTHKKRPKITKNPDVYLTNGLR